MELKTTEMQLVHYTISRLSMAGWWVWRNNSGMLPMEYKGRKRMIKVGQKGVSDVIGFTPEGIFVAAELKIRPNKPTPAQQEFIDNLNRNNGFGKIIYDTDEVEVFIQEYERKFK